MNESPAIIMLKGLDDIDWASLEHAYGEASDVPNLIRSLASNDEEIRRNALWELYGNIFHQGTRYQATVHTIPFIFELIRDPSVPDKASLIKFTVDLALGYPEAFLPKGPNVEDWAIDAEELKEESESEDLDDFDVDWLKHIDAFINSYKAVLNEIETYYNLLENNHPAIKIMAIFGVAWFREMAAESIPKLRNLLRKENDDIILANLLISLSMLDAYVEERKDEEQFRNYFTDHKSLLVKISAAIALVNILNEEVDIAPIDFIMQQLPVIIDMNMSPFEYPWNDGELLGFISEVIKFCAVQFPEKIVPDLSKLLPKLTGVQALNVIYSLLWIVFPEVPEQDSWTLKQLNKFQKMVLRVLAKNDNLWVDENLEMADLSTLLGEYSLPDNQKDLKNFLELDSK
ncbi:MAG: hypothetical protein P8Y23_05005 [Candidatus Lokiarchaeota archaeon]